MGKQHGAIVAATVAAIASHATTLCVRPIRYT